MPIVDENQWKAFRRRAQMRTSRQMALILCPFGIFILTLKILESMDYPAGDIRNSLVFRLSLYGLLILVLGAVIGMAARWPLADRRRR